MLLLDKYFSLEGDGLAHFLSLIRFKEFYLSSPSNFNDPFDSALPIRITKLDYFKLVKMQYGDDPDSFGRAKLARLWALANSNPEEDADEGFAEDLPLVYAEIAKRVGIFCFSSAESAEQSEMYMWSHYANGHRGVCIRFRGDVLMGNSPMAVTYEDDPNPCRVFSGMPNGPTEIIRFYSTKSTDWKIEHEYRYIKIGFAGKTLKFNGSAIVEIRLGAQIGMEHKRLVIDAMRAEEIEDIKILQMKKGDSFGQLDSLHIGGPQ